MDHQVPGPHRQPDGAGEADRFERVESRHRRPDRGGVDRGDRWDTLDASPLRDDLAIAQGRRVVVAAPRGLAAELPKAVAAGDAAAAAADPFSRYHPPPDRYVIFLAGSAEYHSWFHNFQFSSGYTIPGRHSSPIVVNLGLGWQSTTPSVIRHEMGHVVTMRNAKDTKTLWLIEGIAQYIEFHGKTAAQSGMLRYAKDYVRAGGWDGHLAVDFDKPTVTDASLRQTGSYALSYLAVRCLAQRYGDDKLFAFFDGVVRSGRTDLTGVATEALGEPWDAVDKRCATDIRSTLS